MKEIAFNVKELQQTPEYGEFAIEPLEPGFGYTLGHAMRRVLLSSIPGAAVTAIQINGVKHRFSQIQGLKENIIDFLLNVKGLHVRLDGTKESATVKISVKGPKEITGADIQTSEGVSVMNPDHYLGSFADAKGKFEAEFTIERGYGYVLSEEKQIDTLGVISTDAIFTPVTRVNYTVETTRVGRRTNLDKLILQIWTNGVVSPKEALDETAKLLSSYFMQIYNPVAAASSDAAPVSASVSEDLLKLTVDELDLPTRIYNSLRNGGIETLGNLLATPRKDLITMRNMGAKSIGIIEEKLREKGISLTV